MPFLSNLLRYAYLSPLLAKLPPGPNCVLFVKNLNYAMICSTSLASTTEAYDRYALAIKQRQREQRSWSSTTSWMYAAPSTFPPRSTRSD
jgi:hypothetical protein